MYTSAHTVYSFQMQENDNWNKNVTSSEEIDFDSKSSMMFKTEDSSHEQTVHMLCSCVVHPRKSSHI